jgi:hypothetical protein
MASAAGWAAAAAGMLAYAPYSNSNLPSGAQYCSLNGFIFALLGRLWPGDSGAGRRLLVSDSILLRLYSGAFGLEIGQIRARSADSKEIQRPDCNTPAKGVSVVVQLPVDYI